MTREEQIIEAGKIAAEGKEFSVLVNRQHRTMSAYEIGFIEGAEWADSHHQWIPVEERLPAFGQEVLVYAVTRNEKPKLNFNAIFYSWRAFSTRLMASDRTDVCDFMLYFLGSRTDFRGFHVTHWMPMPATPRKEERNEQLESDHQGSR